ncbi:MAG: hypothetical protein QX199_18365 [Methylococcaceae bacterium]
MNPLQWFKKQNTELKFGFIGAVIYMALLVFYTSLYFPALKNIQDHHEVVPRWYYKIPDITGHAMLNARLRSNGALAPWFCNEEKDDCSLEGLDHLWTLFQVLFMEGIYFGFGSGIGAWAHIRKQPLPNKRQ